MSESRPLLHEKMPPDAVENENCPSTSRWSSSSEGTALAANGGTSSPLASAKLVVSSPTSVTCIPEQKSIGGSAQVDVQPSPCEGVSPKIEGKPAHPLFHDGMVAVHPRPKYEATGECYIRGAIKQYLDDSRIQSLCVEGKAHPKGGGGIQGNVVGDDIFERNKQHLPSVSMGRFSSLCSRAITMPSAKDPFTLSGFMLSPHYQNYEYSRTEVEGKLDEVKGIEGQRKIRPEIATKQLGYFPSAASVKDGGRPATAANLNMFSPSVLTPIPTIDQQTFSQYASISQSTSCSFSSLMNTPNGVACSSAHNISHPRQNTPNGHPNKTIPKPMLYMGIILERPETLDSWGLVFSKEKANHAMIVRVISPINGTGRPSVKWCQISQSAPSPSIVFSSSSKSTLDRYEAELVHHFPLPYDENHLHAAGLLVPYLTPGDAIISINGIPVSSFADTAKFASYIRQNCQRKMIIVALRHKTVQEAALAQLARPVIFKSEQNGGMGPIDLKATTDRVSKVITKAWKRILSSGVGSHHQVKRKVACHPIAVKRPKIAYTNKAFRDSDGNPILYCDNDDPDPYEGSRIRGFLDDEIEKSFDVWLQKRKEAWGKHRPLRKINETTTDEVHIEEESTVHHDFWTANGYESFGQWLGASKTKWTRSYSWHKERRSALQSECEREVHFPMMYASTAENILLDQFENWLSVRKQQWRLERRKRQRHRVEVPSDENDAICDSSRSALVKIESNPCSSNFNEDMYIDEILEDQERLAHNEAATQQPMDISWVFDSQLGAPDDVIVNIMTFLHIADHGKLLCLSFGSNYLFKQRSDMWRTLCPTHWVLPRRPRKPWCAIYITKIREEEEASRKRSDDLLVKANVIIEKGDQLNKLEKLIKKTEKAFHFSVNYISCVVLERNSLLNLAVIEGRHKITKWLIEEKGADIESCDRGQFTPLLNAAWNGDKYIVRYLLSKGCDRTKVGYNHSSQGMAAEGGMTAEGWARKRGHEEVAELIRLGL